MLSMSPNRLESPHGFVFMAYDGIWHMPLTALQEKVKTYCCDCDAFGSRLYEGLNRMQ